MDVLLATKPSGGEVDESGDAFVGLLEEASIMHPVVLGVRSIELAVPNPAKAATFFIEVWNLEHVESVGGSIYLRGTGAYHHILALHPSRQDAVVRRIVFDAKDRGDIAAFCERADAFGLHPEKPRELATPGGGFGFGFIDPEGRNYAIICDVEDHRDREDQAGRPRKIAHVNINSAKYDDTTAVLSDVLGFRLIDETPGPTFWHCQNTDHNSMVVSKMSKPTINHIAFELPTLECVMRGAGRMRDAGYPIEWGVGRHGAGNNVFAYFAGPDEMPLELTSEILQIDESYVPRGQDHWRFPPGRADQWGVTSPHTARWMRIQNLLSFEQDVPPPS